MLVDLRYHRRDAKGQMALFSPDTHFVVSMNAKDRKPGFTRGAGACLRGSEQVRSHYPLP